jgi:hypothetical protein
MAGLKGRGATSQQDAFPWTCTSAVLVDDENGRTDGERTNETPVFPGSPRTAVHGWQTMDIFEGTEQIQQLVISRAISGLRIE